MSSQISSIFQGIPPASGRNLLFKVLQENKFDRYYMPCVGRFAATQVVVKAGADPKTIHTSDISLFSSVLGYYFANKPLKDLGIIINDKDLQDKFAEDMSDIDRVTSLMIAMKCVQLEKSAYYFNAFRRELLRNWSRYFEEIKKQIMEHKTLFNGLNYEIMDVRHVIEQCKDDKDALLYINPPNWKGGYTRMFDFQNRIQWNEPKVEQIEVDEFYMQIEKLLGAKATVILNTAVIKAPEGWVKLLTEEKFNYVNRLIANRPFTDRHIVMKKDDLTKAPYPLYDDHEITKETKIKIVPLGREQAYYYRDLFIHKLGSTGAHSNYAVLIDGQFMSVLGLMNRFLFGVDVKAKVGQYDHINEIYGMTMPSKRYKRLSRLFMMLITCNEFKKYLCNTVSNIEMTEFRTFHTTCIAKYPEVRINHGILKLVNKEQLKNGNWKLIYHTPFYERTYRQSIILWLDENRREGQKNVAR